ncbi:RNA-binding cell elongation regulator Jag/EloR [Saccharibacillus kuerlensis]|uniref:RNA-binding protein KhpB n=1 Tax=Saccharibacillus kuerlensis TaxID=459527 RepID=A0ABQ2KY56_9BACL|nr:RNA-binding cell elongation regulator Jag/EloR [Saccharibacillus kuerlensis]GGN95224.1 single-stranded DNA-binding protein [Saccharibacillus kuerlensis]
MTSKVTAVGKTVDEAISQGLAQLGVTRDRVEVNVLEHPSKGFLGLFGGRKAKIELTLIRSGRVLQESASSVSEAKVSTEPVAIPEPGEFENQPPRRESPNPAAPDPSSPNPVEEDENLPRRQRPNPAAPAPMGTESAEIETLSSSARAEERYREAAAFIRDVAEAMGLEVVVDVRRTRDGGLLDISGPELGMLIGRRGQTLDALQLLASVVANQGSDKFVRLTLDAENFRRRRAKTLEELADRLAERVIRTRKEVVLEPMPPQERKVIHARLQSHPKVETGSRGEEPNRRVVITLK